MELAERLKPADDDTRLAEATFKLALHFEAVGDSERALTHFAAAQQLAPDNWNYQRQGWNHKGKIYAGLNVALAHGDRNRRGDWPSRWVVLTVLVERDNPIVGQCRMEIGPSPMYRR